MSGLSGPRVMSNDSKEMRKKEDNEDTDHLSTMSESKSGRERFAIKKSYSIENGYESGRRSLVADAKFESRIREEERRSWIKAVRQTSQELNDDELGDDDVFVLESIAEDSRDQETLRVTLVLCLKETLIALGRIIKLIEVNEGRVVHMETRASLKVSTALDVLIQVEMRYSNLLHLVKMLKKCPQLEAVNLVASKAINVKFQWFPRHVSELDSCNHLMTKFEPDLDMDHPGWNDLAYRARRKFIADISFNFRHGDPIPRITYTPDEISTWGAVFSKVVELLPNRACGTHLRLLECLRSECNFNEHNIPQLEDVSNFLKKSSGFSLRPAAGLVTARDFLASLAFRVFQCTQYVRHASRPHHSPEPDVIHELLGHCPLLADPLFAQFSQELGLASLGASDADIEKLSTVYWFTVEFGLCRESGQLRAYGAGLLSSFGELLHALSEKPELRNFEPAAAAIQEYDDQAYQDIYYVADSFEDAIDKFRRWVSASLRRPVEMRFNPYTQTVEMIDSLEDMETIVTQMRRELQHLNSALNRIRS